MKLAFLSLAAIALTGVGCYRVVFVWPDEPLKVSVVGGCPTLVNRDSDGGVATSDPADAGVDVSHEPQHAKISGGPVRLASSGTLVFVDYNGATSGTGITVYEVDAASPIEQSCDGQSRRELWKVRNGGRWDAQVTVEKGKVICAQSSDYADGEVGWLVR